MEKGRILLAVTGFHPQRWRELLSAEREVVLEPDGAKDPSITYAVVWKQKPNLLSSLPNLRAIFSIGAGVDHIFADPGLPDVPIVKVVADNLTQYMTEYVVWRVLDHHRQGLLFRQQQQRRSGTSRRSDRPATFPSALWGSAISAAPRLGAAVARLRGQWLVAQRPADARVATYSGEAGLIPFLKATDILVVLLPLTPDTQGIINYGVLKELRKRNGLGGSVLINAGRGRLQKDADIVRALDDGTLKEASLDVFEVEPLPKTSPLWNHPKVFVTPHAAATSDPMHLAPIMLRQMDAFERGEKLENLVDRKAGY